MTARDYSYLCGECGKITAVVEWDALVWDDDHEHLLPAQAGQMDPLLQCPACCYIHTDDDSGPGVWDGTRLEVHRIRRDLLAEKDGPWADAWAS
jgi:hypothetical protein